MQHSHSEEEFKQVLKNLFAEKKRVKELEKQLEEKSVQKKFQTKLTDIHKLSLTEEYAKLKAAYYEKEKESEHYKSQFEKVRPALKKLVDDLKEAHSTITSLKEQLECVALECAALQKSRIPLEEELKVTRQRVNLLEGQKEVFDQKVQELERTKMEEKNERHRLESERGGLVEKLADAFSQMQRQSEMIKDLRFELSSIHKQTQEDEKKIQQLENASLSKLGNQELVSYQEEVLQRCYLKMRDLSSRHGAWMEEKECIQAEVRKAFDQLAKKVRESTLLQELVDKQSLQLVGLQRQLQELQQMRTTYAHMASTIESLKRILGNTFEPTVEDSKNPRD